VRHQVDFSKARQLVVPRRECAYRDLPLEQAPGPCNPSALRPNFQGLVGRIGVSSPKSGAIDDSCLATLSLG